MTLIEKAVGKFPNTSVSDWRMVGKAAVHKSVTASDTCQFRGPAVLRGGEFRGGVFYSGVFHGGVFHGGEFHGGDFRCGIFYGGEFHGGVFHGGYFRGGYFRGGEFRGGVFHGGVFRGGVFHGGEFQGGSFFGGVFETTPLQLSGLLPWSIVVQGECDGRIAIGCECHSMADWHLNGEDICWKHKANWTDVQAALDRLGQLRI